MKRYCFHIVLLLISISVEAQTEAILNRQRAIFLHNFTRQIGWPEPFEIFKIGILGDDKIIPEIERFVERGRLVQGRPIELVKLQTIEEAVDIQLVYLNQELGYDIEKLLTHVQGQGILVVSEDYPYNSSMINMVMVDGAFQFEIHQDRLEAENFELTSYFKDLAISTANTWQQLYQKSKESLEEERQKVADQRDLIDKQEEMIINQSNRISSKTEELDKLSEEYNQLVERNKEQEKRFVERTDELNNLEEQFASKLTEIENRQTEINLLDSTLSARQKEIESQNDQIEAQSVTLNTQRQELNYQKNFSILLGGIAALMFITGFFIWKNYREKKKSNLALEQKNKEIEATSDELRMVNKEMEQFAYLASHDLQEPLNTISGWIQMINPDQLDKDGKLSVELISNASARMRMLIQGLLEYSQLGSHIEFEEVNCNTLIQDVLNNLTRVIEDNQVTVDVSELPVIQGHSLKLSMLFQNLLSNSIKFRKEGTHPIIKISSKPAEDGMHQFEISDNGIGIKEENLKSIFDIFHREHSRDKYEGTGIGLAHVRKIIEMHKGRIWVDSTLGEGTTFHFTLLGL